MARAEAVIAGALLLAGTLPVQARVQDYQIVRLLTYTTDCGVESLTLAPAGKAPRYFASCTNVTFFPEGVEVQCDDPDDERSCRVLTKARNFDHLHALDRKD